MKTLNNICNTCLVILSLLIVSALMRTADVEWIRLAAMSAWLPVAFISFCHLVLDVVKSVRGAE